jgi:uncharacterized phosphatase
MKTLYFVRHGESEDNSNFIWSRPDTPLTETGRAQARETAKNILEQGLAFDLIVVSPLPRTKETAKIIIEVTGHPETHVEYNDLLVERNWGSLAGTSDKDYYTNGRTIRDIDKAKGAERLKDVQKRAKMIFDHLSSRPEATILIVGHGSFGRALRRVVNGEPHTHEYHPNLVRFKNAEISRLV